MRGRPGHVRVGAHGGRATMAGLGQREVSGRLDCLARRVLAWVELEVRLAFVFNLNG